MNIFNFFIYHYQNFKKITITVGKNLSVNENSYLISKTELGDNVNFNGIKNTKS